MATTPGKTIGNKLQRYHLHLIPLENKRGQSL